jgi:hypothetical protein
MAIDATITAFRDATARWSAGFGDAAAVVRAACDVLAAGHGGMAMAMLAGVHLRRADEGAPDLLPDALAEVGLPFVPRGDKAGQEYWVATMAEGVLTGALSPRELAAWAHREIGHDGLDAAQRLVTLDDEYDDAAFLAEHYGHPAVDASDLDAEVIAEARRLAERASSGGASPTTV